MGVLFEKQAISEIPNLLSRLLEMPEGQVVVHLHAKGSGPDAEIRAGKHTFLVEFKSSSARTPLTQAVSKFEKHGKNQGEGVIPLLIVPYMGETGRRFCEEREISWLDLSGNAHIKAAGLLIRVEGKPNRFRKAGRPPNLYAPKSSRIVRQFLIQPARALNQRDLARAADLDEGYTSRIVRRLEDNGLVVRDKKGLLRPRDPEHLLDAWHESYDFMKHHIIKGHVAARSGDEVLRRVSEVLHREHVDYAATGLSAAWLYTHFAGFRMATLYLHHLPPDKLSHKLGFREDDRGANTWLVIPNDEGVFHGSEVRENIRCVHPVQVYLDLKAHPERSVDAASILRQEYMKWREDA